MKVLRPYQEEALTRSDGHPGFAYFMEQRTGKTPVAIHDVRRAWDRAEITGCLVVSPKGPLSQWEGRAEDESGFAYWLDRPAILQRWRQGAKPDRRLLERGAELRVLAINYDALVATPTAWTFVEAFCLAHQVFLILDESHYCKTPGAQRTKKLLKLAARARYVRLLTGTPNPEGHPLDLWTQGQMLGVRGWLQSFYAFKNRYAEQQGNPELLAKIEQAITELALERGTWVQAMQHEPSARYNEVMLTKVTSDKGQTTAVTRRAGRTLVEVVVADRFKRMVELRKPPFLLVATYRHLDELKAQLDPYVYRVTRAEVWPHMPPKQFIKLEVPMGRDQARAYDELKRRLRTELAGKEIEAPLAITKLLRLLQVLGGHVGTVDGDVARVTDNQRVDYLAEYLEDLDGQAIIWARFTPQVDELCTRAQQLGLTWTRYDGRITDKRREAGKVAFQQGDVQLFIGNQKAGGPGLTLDAAETVIYYSHDPSLVVRQQSEDRPVSETNKVTVVDLWTPGTVEGQVLQALRDKRNLAATLTGDELASWL